MRWATDVFPGPVGADVAHASPGVRNQPSMASLVWSINKDATQYAAVSSVQEPGREIIADLTSMMTACRVSFWRSHLDQLTFLDS